MRVFDAMSKAVETVKPSVAASEAKTRTLSDLLELLARAPEHRSNRDLRRARVEP